MNTKRLWVAWGQCQHKITEILPHSGGDFQKWLRREKLFADEFEKRLDERDAWEAPAANWLKLVAIGKDLSRWNETKMVYEKKAAESQKHLSQISRQWQEMTDLARGRAPAKGGIGATTTIYVDWGAANSTGETAA